MPDPSVVNEPIAHLIPMIGHLHREAIHSRMREMGLYSGQGRVLLALSERDGQTPSELGSMRGVKPSTITKTLQRMEKEGYVSRCRDPEDGRVVRVHITQAGRDIHEQIGAFFREFEEHQLRSLTADELVILRRLLIQVVENIQDFLDR